MTTAFFRPDGRPTRRTLIIGLACGGTAIGAAVTSFLVESLAFPWFAPPEILSLKVATFKRERSSNSHI
jgi:hypothetical protein